MRLTWYMGSGMYEVMVRKTFSAAHTVTIDGVREPLHGHNFAVEITLSSRELDDEGLVIDFRKIKRWLEEILREFDHTYLNDLPRFKNVTPTAERLARCIHDHIEAQMESTQYTIERVTVWESESACATYRGIA